MLHSDVPLNYLFSNEKPSDLYISDEHRKLMDDLSMNKDSVICFKEIFYEIWIIEKNIAISRLDYLRIFLQEKKKCESKNVNSISIKIKLSFILLILGLLSTELNHV